MNVKTLARASAVVCGGLVLAFSGWAAEPATGESPATSAIRLVPPLEPAGKDRIVAETLVLEKTVQTVVFYLDGEPVGRARHPPFDAKIRLVTPPRPQRLKVVALDDRDQPVGEDEITLNPARRPLRVHLSELRPMPGRVAFRAQLSVPDEVTVSGIDVYLNDTLVSTHDAGLARTGELASDLPRPAPAPGDFVRVVMRLSDGREIEDAHLVEGAGFEEELAVHLVQLQVVVTDRQGRPIPDLTARELEVREGGTVRPIARMYLAGEVSLVLGLAVDSSGSMQPLWPATREAASAFLTQTIRGRDRGFLVDFDADLRLRAGITDDVDVLLRGLEGVEPQGGTALYDSILFSLLQFDRQPGRRALVVITDGIDSRSLTDPDRTVEFGKKLGVPVYIIALQSSRQMMPGAGGFGFRAPTTNALHVLTDPTGGRLYRPPNHDAVLVALQQIHRELRTQYVVTYYSETGPNQPLPKIDVRVARKDTKVKVAYGVDQIDR